MVRGGRLQSQRSDRLQDRFWQVLSFRQACRFANLRSAGDLPSGIRDVHIRYRAYPFIDAAERGPGASTDCIGRARRQSRIDMTTLTLQDGTAASALARQDEAIESVIASWNTPNVPEPRTALGASCALFTTKRGMVVDARKVGIGL
jgi:hypothetical protein